MLRAGEGGEYRDERWVAMEARRVPFLAFEARAVRALGVEVVERNMSV